MKKQELIMGSAKKIALVAHDNKKDDMVEWADFIISSPLMAADYARRLPDYDDYEERMNDNAFLKSAEPLAT